MTDQDVPAKSWPERFAVPLTGLTAGAFGVRSTQRRKRVFHPVGVAFEGLLHLNPQATNVVPHELSDSTKVIVRFSRGAGVPEPIPDVLGLAVKIPLASANTGEQDLLFASAGTVPGLRNLLMPAKSFFTPSYSSILPYRLASKRQIVFGAKADSSLRGRKGDFGDLNAAAASMSLRFDLLVAGLTGPWTTIGSLEVRQQLSQEVSRQLRFNPWHTHPELQPAGPLNTMRRSAYIASQRARPDT